METEEPQELSTASTLEIISHKDRQKQRRMAKRRRGIFFLILAIFLLAVLAVSITVVLLLKRRSDDPASGPNTDGSSSQNNSALIERQFFLKVQEAYFDSYPEMITTKPGITVNEIRARFRSFDYSPTALKRTADRASQLRSEFANVFAKLAEANLNERELKAVHEMRQFLRHFGGQGPYDTSYYTGVWMLGPNTMVWEPIAQMWSWFESVFTSADLRPRNLTEFEHLLDLMSKMKDSISNYTENMRMGVKKGMVRNMESCRAGLRSFKSVFRKFALHNETAVLESRFLRPLFLQKIHSEMRRDWERENKKNMTTSLRDALILYVGKPLTELIRYMENEHMRHCVPSNVSSGLASLPLRYVYMDCVPDLSRPTDPYLPTGERLNGSLAFETILTYYTTTDITAAKIQAMGHQKLKALKEQVVTLAKEVTNESNETIAVGKFREKLSMRSMYFNKQAFPANESEEDTYLKCYDVHSAQRYCPKRWQAYNDWENSTQTIQQILRQKITQLFYATGEKKTTLSCLAMVQPNFHPISSYHSYIKSRKCGIHKLPFFIDNYGPEYSEWTVTAHETEPGHNLEVIGYYHNFAKKKTVDTIKWLSHMTYFPAFSEGWATYAEYPLVGQDLHVYRNDLMSKYGMLQQQIMGALRLVIETGLHSFGMSRSAALQLFEEYAWESGDIATKEITRYQSVQGQAVSYIVGQTAFMTARALAEKELGTQFSLKEFHYRVLRQGEAPLGYLEQIVQRYVTCTKAGDKMDDTWTRKCKEVMT